MSKETRWVSLPEEEVDKILRAGLVAARSALDEHDKWERSRVIFRAMSVADRAMRLAFSLAEDREAENGNKVYWLHPDLCHLMATALWSKAEDIPIEECHPYAQATSWVEPLSRAVAAASLFGEASYLISEDSGGGVSVFDFDPTASILES